MCEDERAVVLARHGVGDIYGFIELLGGSTSERGLTGDGITSHSMLKALSLTREAFTST